MLKRRVMMRAALAAILVVPAAAQDVSDLDVSEAEVFIGNWSVTMQTPQGEVTMLLALEDMGGKVKGTVSNDLAGAVTVSDISRSGDDLVLKYNADMQGTPVPVSATLTPTGDDISVNFDFGGQFSLVGTGSRE